MSNIRAAAVIGIGSCLELAKACRSKQEIIKELTKFLEEQKAQL